MRNLLRATMRAALLPILVKIDICSNLDKERQRIGIQMPPKQLMLAG